eukprot:72418-Alexandrium_andersonii.AAC.1
MISRVARKRLAPSAHVEVCDIQGAISGVLAASGSRDLPALLGPIANGSWKQAPRPQHFAKYEQLLCSLSSTDSKAILAHKKVTQAVLAAHDDSTCLFAKRLPERSAQRK